MNYEIHGLCFPCLIKVNLFSTDKESVFKEVHLCDVPNDLYTGKSSITWYKKLSDFNLEPQIEAELTEKLKKLIDSVDAPKEKGFKVKHFSTSVTQGYRAVFYNSELFMDNFGDDIQLINGIWQSKYSSKEDDEKLVISALRRFLFNRYQLPKSYYVFNIPLKREKNGFCCRFDVDLNTVFLAISYQEKDLSVLFDVSLSEGPFVCAQKIDEILSSYNL